MRRCLPWQVPPKSVRHCDCIESGICAGRSSLHLLFCYVFLICNFKTKRRGHVKCLMISDNLVRTIQASSNLWPIAVSHTRGSRRSHSNLALGSLRPSGPTGNSRGPLGLTAARARPELQALLAAHPRSARVGSSSAWRRPLALRSPRRGLLLWRCLKASCLQGMQASP